MILTLVFTCPDSGRAFASADFDIAANRGIVTDAAGNRMLDAEVVLTRPCPFCGQKHIYQAGELACPLARQPGTRKRGGEP